MDSRKRRIAVFTGNRSEYGLQYPILKAIAADLRLEYHLIVGGAHLDPTFGRTLAEIEEDGFRVYRQVEISPASNPLNQTAHSIGSGVISISAILADLRPDFLVVYGDRFESFAATIASTQTNIPTAHIEGGDYTDGGALDDSVRHAMTKLSHLHFTTNAQATERVLKLGEEPWRVFTVGLPALDLIAGKEHSSPEELIAEFALDPSRPVLLFCQHSVTTEQEHAPDQIRPSLDAMERLAREGYQIVMTYPNDDAGGRAIIAEIERFRAFGLTSVRIVRSLGRRRFHGMLNFIGRVGCGAVVGNSSAGIKETPAFGCPAVNIGSRQYGRLRASNAIDVAYDAGAIEAAVRKCVDDTAFRLQCRICENPYGAGSAGRKVAEVLSTVPVNTRLLQKRMTY